MRIKTETAMKSEVVENMILESSGVEQEDELGNNKQMGIYETELNH